MRVTAAYSCRRLNKSTFLIIHDDTYEEHPFIYVKIYDKPQLVVIFDTGCGPTAAAGHDIKIKNLKQYIEEFPIPDNEHEPLNPEGPLQRHYMVILTHCHYDHICGVESFASLINTEIVASGNDKDFLSYENLPNSSLCAQRGIKTPQYTITTFAMDREWLIYHGHNLHLQALHTPGHTPDSLAIYDEEENMLFTGDSFYRRRCTLPGGASFTQAIEFPPQGSWIDYMASMRDLLSFVESLEASTRKGRSEIIHAACAHTTTGVSAKEILEHVLDYFNRIICDEIPAKSQMEHHGELFTLWQEDGDPELSVMAPQRLKDEVLRNRRGNNQEVTGIPNGFCGEHRWRSQHSNL